MLASGLLAVGLYLFYRSVPVLGVSVAATLDLIRPLLPMQLVGGGFLILGSFLVIRTRFR